MRIAVVGASGNIGTALLRALQADGRQHEVIGVVRRPPPPEPPYDAVLWHALDIADPVAPERLAAIVAGVDVVVNLAWGFQPSHDPAYLERVGVGGTRAVLDAVRTAGVGHLVHMSSVGTYSPARSGQRVTEDYPRDGIPSSPYSQHKAAAERLLDRAERDAGEDLLIARMRPGLVLQRAAGSSLLRYGLPALVPAAVLRWLPLLPLDQQFCVPVVHSDDVADAIVRVVEQRAGGAFNLSAEPSIGRREVAAALGAKAVQLPAKVLRGAADLAWRLHLQPLDPGWIDLAFGVPLLDTTRARDVLGWAPTVDARRALGELIEGMRDRDATASPVLRRRSTREQLTDLLTVGPITRRRKS
ncbi:NAD-dependent epimerase/dehydratase family protein [Nakamurella flavida]|uniref:NAD-dependent epimerase/dehydratase family protein n=1 Tax=Nakamurella flavida TaxID=363630 RepID=A0A938YEX5_9ACTN|nr:NAD-dependent epimerase/dehydratase family protein [Nakamurella flavida]MBM9476420.1 NAD-dependent epimerase/dehydratase family protein [Nakamurella flavida]MDP9779479.1 nucleoside-diphosphate-sugar epimerase [Nakamurella flavida]